jgi:hypothetical protein
MFDADKRMQSKIKTGGKARPATAATKRPTNSIYDDLKLTETLFEEL